MWDVKRKRPNSFVRSLNPEIRLQRQAEEQLIPIKCNLLAFLRKPYQIKCVISVVIRDLKSDPWPPANNLAVDVPAETKVVLNCTIQFATYCLSVWRLQVGAADCYRRRVYYEAFTGLCTEKVVRCMQHAVLTFEVTQSLTPPATFLQVWQSSPVQVSCFLIIRCQLLITFIALVYSVYINMFNTTSDLSCPIGIPSTSIKNSS
jgi:hypothetical protein